MIHHSVGLLPLVQTTQDVIESLVLLNPREQQGFEMNSEEMGYLYMFVGLLRSINPHILFLYSLTTVS